mmetsp:Transcript_28948/g.42032  ORF Transcript_28948/g.42032 Transcript_28948/m.42032 type:complete len:666 (+) Transcript_28948:444-2441(+)
MIARKLLGRLSAYRCIHRMSPTTDDSMSLEHAFKSSFVKWLFEEACTDDKQKKSRSKRGNWHSGGKPRTLNPNILATLKSSGSVESLVAENSCVIQKADKVWHGYENYAKETNLISKTPQLLYESTCVTLSEETIRKYCSEGKYFVIEKQLKIIQLKTDEGSIGTEEVSAIAKHLLVAYSSSEECTSLANLILKWVPLLTQLHGDSSLWEIIFLLPPDEFHSEASCMSISLIARCASLWTSLHIGSCQFWILGVMCGRGIQSKLSLLLMLRFLVTTLGQQSVQSISFSDNITRRKSECLATQDNATGAIRLALDCAELLYSKNTNPTPIKGSNSDVMSLALECVKIYHTEYTNSTDCTMPGSSFATTCVSNLQSRNAHDDRNILPIWLVLILQVAKCGKKHLDLVTKVLLSLLPSSGWEGQIIPVALLRLYAYFPSLMALNDPKLRGILLDAAGENASKWLEWRSPLDSQLSEMIKNLSVNPHQRLLQSMSDFSKRHPLVVARHFGTLVHILDDDASACSERRGRVNEKSSCEFATAKVELGSIRITVRHWGYSFTETVWTSVIEILMALPSEVMFTCGQKMGLMKLLAIYLKLIFTQKQINCEENTSRIKEKLSKLLHAFQASNKQSWENWVECKLPEIETWGKIKEILLECQLISDTVKQQVP